MIPHARTLISLSLILIIVQSVSCLWQPDNSKREALCNSPACVARGEEYKNNRDRSYHPCEDFYAFTCGKWTNKHPGPKFYSQWTLVDVIYWKFVSIIKHTLETYPIPSGKVSLIRQAKKVYETCLKIPEYPVKKAEDIKREILKIGRHPAVPLWELHNKYLRLSGESPFFGIEVMAGSPMDGTAVIMLTESPGAFGAILHGGDWKPQEEQNYIDFLFRIMKNVNLEDRVVKEKIVEVFKFRRSLYQIIAKSKNMPPNKLMPVTKTELDEWLASESRRVPAAQQAPWATIIDVALEKLDPETKPDQKLVAMRRKEYFRDLINFLKDVPQYILANHIEIYFVERHLQWDKEMMTLLRGTSIDRPNFLSYVKERYFKRWELCIDKHNMKETLEKMLYEKWFPKETIKIVQEMIVKVKAEIDGQMRRSTWMDPTSRAQTMERLNELEHWIGFPNWLYEGRPARKRDNTKDILRPNALLDNSKDLLYIHAALMLPPVFDLQIPTLYNYGSLGATIGHELYHTFDNCAMRYDCQLRLDKFVPMYNTITDREFKNHYNMTIQSKTWKSLPENFPDVMGLEAAYYAYHKLVSQNPSICKVLPGFEDYSCDQMFYISFANGFCGTYTKKAALDKLQTSKHSLESVRVNGAAAQMASFGTAFKCRVGSPMNPEKKVNIMH